MEHLLLSLAVIVLSTIGIISMYLRRKSRDVNNTQYDQALVALLIMLLLGLLMFGTSLHYHSNRHNLINIQAL